MAKEMFPVEKTLKKLKRKSELLAKQRGLPCLYKKEHEEFYREDIQAANNRPGSARDLIIEQLKTLEELEALEKVGKL